MVGPLGSIAIAHDEGAAGGVAKEVVDLLLPPVVVRAGVDADLVGL